MEMLIIGVIVAVALLCPVTMFGPAVLQRLGLRKRSSPAMSCAQSTPATGTASTHELLRAKRDALDGEIALLEADIARTGDETNMARPRARG